jgi:phosphoserine phosphatase
MEQVLTVIGDPSSRALSQDQAEATQQILHDAGARTAAIDWLAPGIACDIPFAGLAPDAAEKTVRRGLAGARLDLAAQAAAGRRKALLVADMESTIIAQEMIDELAERFGLGGRVAAITARAVAGELGFEDALTTRVALLAGLPEAAIDEVAARITLNPGARTLVQTMKSAGAYTALVSGGFTVFTRRVRDTCGFDEDRANRLLVEAGALTGRVAEPILGRQAKLAALQEIAAERGVPLSAAIAVGDGANDAVMLARAGLGVGYRPTAPARVAANVSIDQGDLTALLYLQGYRADEFVTDTNLRG